MTLSPSDTERLLIWKGAIKAWLQHPILGWGLDNFLGAFRANRGLAYIDTPALHGNEFGMQGDAHNLILQVLVTNGVVGLLVFCVLIYKLISFLESKKNESIYCNAVRGCVYGLFLAGMIEPISFSCWCLVAILLGSIA